MRLVEQDGPVLRTLHGIKQVALEDSGGLKRMNFCLDQQGVKIILKVANIDSR